VADASDDRSAFTGLVHAPDGSGAKLTAMAVFHVGDADEAERDLEPFKAWGSPAAVEVGPMPYPVMNTLLDEGYPIGALNYWLSTFTSSLSDELIQVLMGTVCDRSLADDINPVRALPRRGDPRRHDRHSGAPP
jgi:hypothetical protein